MDIQQGDRVTVVNSLYGMYDNKKGVVHRVLGESVEVILDVNRGKIGEITRLSIKNIERIEGNEKSPIQAIADLLPKQEEAEMKSKEGQVCIDDRMDILENILNKYDLSVKEGCGFMYIYDFLDDLTSKWEELDKKDKEDVAFCILGENFKIV